MDPSSRETPGISLPAPVAAPGPDSAKTTAPPATVTPAAVTPAAVTPAASSTGSSVLEDNDKIEKEWVGKVRRIIRQTRGDPHKQSKELTLVRADYMKQRYNKIIKVEK